MTVKARDIVSPVTLVFLIIALLCLSFLYANAAGNIWAAWQTEEFSHGVLLPFVALVWTVAILQKNPQPLRPSSLGVLFLLIGIGLDLLGAVTANNWLSQISILPSIAGLVALLFGSGITRALLAPIILLFFAIPLPSTVYSVLTAKMQLLSSDLGVLGIESFGLPVFQEGNVIDLGDTKLQVAEACSGLRYLFPLMTLGYLAAFFAFKTTWKRIALFALTLPITIVMNAIRIVFIGITVDLWGAKMAEGTLHEAEGFIVFLGCTLCLWLAAVALAACKPKEALQFPAWSLRLRAPLWSGRIAPHICLLITASLILLSSASALLYLHRQDAKPLPYHQALEDFPMQIGDWRGRSSLLDADQLHSLQLSSYVLADYAAPGETNPVNFYIAFYASQRQGSSIHSPTICIPGAGWEIASLAPVTLRLDLPGIETLTVNKALLKKGNATELVFYWFRERGHDVTSIFDTKWMMVRDYMRSGRTDGSLIRLSTPILPGQTEQQAEQSLTNFLTQALPLLPTYLPPAL